MRRQYQQMQLARRARRLLTIRITRSHTLSAGSSCFSVPGALLRGWSGRRQGVGVRAAVAAAPAAAPAAPATFSVDAHANGKVCATARHQQHVDTGCVS